MRQERPERLPLSFAQHRLWFLDRLENSGVEYNVRAALRLRGELDVTALEQAIDALVGRHETLRTRFEEQEGEPFQVIESEVRIPLRVEDLSTLGENERQRAIESALRREAEEPFDLREGPLLRMGLLRLGACDHILVWSCHHIISDGWSMAVFHRDMRFAYEAFCDGGSNPLESLPDPVCRLCALAAELDAEQGTGAPAGILARAARWCGDSGVAHGSASTAKAELFGRAP